MHILHTISGLSFGGAERIAVGLAKEARRSGHDVSFLTIFPGNYYGDVLVDLDIPVFNCGFDGKFTYPNILKYTKTRRVFYEHIKKICPDVIHAQLFAPKLFFFGLPRSLSIPIIHTAQDNNPWWDGRTISARTKTYIERHFVKQVASHNIAVSESVRSNMCRLFDLNATECPIIPNFYTHDVPAVRRSAKNEIKTIGMVTRLVWDKKGLDLAGRILARLFRETSQTRCVIVGDGPDRSRFESYIMSLGIGGRVEFRGYVSDVPSVYEEIDVLLMTSRYEGLSLTAVEAAYSGIPAVLSDVPGLREAVIDGETGFLCPINNECTFVERIRSLVENESLYSRIAGTAQSVAQGLYSPEAAFAAYLNLYQRATEIKH